MSAWGALALVVDSPVESEPPALERELATAGRALVDYRRALRRGDWTEAKRVESRMFEVAQRLDDLGFGAEGTMDGLNPDSGEHDDA